MDLQEYPPMTDHIPSLAVVIPCYNEEEMLPKTLATMLTLREQMIARGKISPDSKIYLVDDGSKDKTWDILSDAANSNTAIVGVKLSRNKGHQNALYAGLCVTTEDITVSIDADLQDDPQNIEAMVDEYLKGHDVVYGVRSARDTDTFFKRFTAEGYYHLMKKMGVDLVFNHADFRLMSRRALEALKEYGESNLFLRGVVREVGFPSSVVEYERQAREAGESKYPLKKMLSFAWKGITAFSTAPLRMITLLGLLSGFASFTLIAWVLVIRFFTDNATPGWASVLLPLLFIGSVQLLCLGIIGEYLSKIYEEVKRRPKFHISDIARKDN
ncbi:glycosyl transferase, putative, gt2H [Cellvibrio japonicus Ueda107]|uniref:Glycosyl transferase, putative, gt2H n=2 Tax=Cellvibrio japonicus TaxID=155077 RepID=B3PEB2_CELJU|nr:glycosyl transferase, putative, gt2H [Cellvibrio japonicus Ueda107]